MPRPWTITVKDFPSRRPDQWYRCQVVKVDRGRNASEVRLVLQDLCQEQAGRRTTVILPALRPDGLAADFVRAALNVEVRPGEAIRPREAQGAIVAVQFAPAGGEDQIIAIRPDHKETDHDADSEHEL